MQQEPSARPTYSALLAALRSSVDTLTDEVVRDVRRPGDDDADVATLVRPVVSWTIEALSEASQLPAERLELLRAEGRVAALAGQVLERVLDRYLSTGWVVWGAATSRASDADAAAIAALGTALLKAGDAAAAAIADGFGEAERSLALRAAGARHEFLDAVLDLAPGDADAAGRVRRRAAEFGLDSTAPYRVVVAAVGHDVGEGSSDVDSVALALTPTQRTGAPHGLGQAGAAAEPLVVSRRGRLVVLVPTAAPLPAGLADAFRAIGDGAWLAVTSPVRPGLARVGEAYGEAVEALAVAARLGRTGVIDADSVLLERALLADEPLLARAVAHELAPILAARRGAQALLGTLEAFLASTENLRATARRLGVAPRTVAYRMARIEALVGEPVRGERLQRLATALLAARLLPAVGVPAIADGAGRAAGELEPRDPVSTRKSVATGPADRPRRGPGGRSRPRRSRGTAT